MRRRPVVRLRGWRQQGSMACIAGLCGVRTCLPRSQTSKSACAGHCGLGGVESVERLRVSVVRSLKFSKTSGMGAKQP